MFMLMIVNLKRSIVVSWKKMWKSLKCIYPAIRGQ